MSDNWQHKIQNFATPPPLGAWEQISNALDKDADLKKGDFVSRLNNYSVEPPIGVWQNVANALDENTEKIIPLNKPSKVVYFRMAAAAAVLALVASTVWFGLNNDKTENTVQKETATIVQPKSTEKSTEKAIVAENNDKVNQTPSTKNNIIKVAHGGASEIAAVGKNNANKSSSVVILPGYIKENDVKDLAANPAELGKEKMQNAAGQTPNDIALMNAPNTYISVTGPDGQIVKVSAKFGKLVGDLNNNKSETQENLDIIINESAKWRKIFAAWRNKMNNSDLTPSINNCMDIIELEKLLKEN